MTQLIGTLINQQVVALRWLRLMLNRSYCIYDQRSNEDHHRLHHRRCRTRQLARRRALLDSQSDGGSERDEAPEPGEGHQPLPSPRGVQLK
jgi:hypothetical protein